MFFHHSNQFCKNQNKFGANVYMNTIFNKTADTVVCHLALLYRWSKEETRVIRNHICDVISYLEKAFSFERGICLVPWKFIRQIPRYPKSQRTNTPATGKKRKNQELVEENNIPLLSTNQKTGFIYKGELHIKTHYVQ